MRILHISAGNLYGGVERIVAECASARQLQPDVDPAFAVCFDGRLAREIRGTGAACHLLGDVKASRPHTVFRARKRLADLIGAIGPEVVVCHSSWAFGLSAPVLRRRDVASAIWVHDRLSGHPWAERWAALSRPDVVICNSRHTAGTARTVFPDSDAHVVYAPVRRPVPLSEQDRQSLRASLGADLSTCVVLTAARFEAWKGHRELLQALAPIASPWQLWVAGGAQKPAEKGYVEALQAQCRASGIQDRVRFLGHRDDVPALMQGADLLCQPNTAPEPFGLVFVEALYAGIPVVTTAAGGALEIVSPDCGVLVEPGSADALTAALRRVVNDPAQRRGLGAAGPARAALLCDPAARLQDLARVLATVRTHATQ